MPGRLQDKVAIITGAASGQGRAAAGIFGREGAHLVLSDLNGPGLEQTAAHAHDAGAREITVHVGDLTQEAENAELVKLAIDHYRRLDVMYNNVGRGRFAPIAEATLEDWNFTIANELTNIFLGCKYALRAMLEHGPGVIINTASTSALYGVPGHGVHAATKAAIIGLTRQIAVEYGPKGIRCNAIAPAYVDYSGPEGARWLAGPDHHRQIARGVDEYPLGRFTSPEDPVNCALFLASDEASFITGQVFIIDGGKTAW
jgi:NAD(P)-dependent dehydrogenase (short-subunit alcohol dehydrogenase family)